MKNQNVQAEEQKVHIVPEDEELLRQMASMPDDVLKMMAVYGYGLIAGRKLAQAGS